MAGIGCQNQSVWMVQKSGNSVPKLVFYSEREIAMLITKNLQAEQATHFAKIRYFATETN